MSHAGSPYFSSEKPDIPLRQPLEEEGKSKRKAAKDIFEREKWEKVMQNKLQKQLEEEKKLEDKKKKLAKKFTTAEKLVKKTHEQELKKAQEWEIKRAKAKEKEERLRKDRERDLNKKFFMNEKKRAETVQKRINDRRMKERNVYEKDQKHIMAQRNLSVTRQQEDDLEVSQKLEDFERKMNIVAHNKLLELSK